MIVDGKKISKELIKDLREKVSKMGQVPMLVALQVGNDPATESFVKIKQKVAEKIGVAFEVAELSDDITTDQMVDRVETISKDPLVGGVIVQLPLPEYLNIDVILNSISSHKDVDVLSDEAREEGHLFAPVAEAAKEVLNRKKVSLKEKNILVIGEGRLVGKPIIEWLKSEGVDPVVANIETEDLKSLTLKADIIFSGAGMPGLVTADMVKDGVVIIDAGTSEEGGVIKGDVEDEAKEKASLATPVPGGMGPIVVAKLFQNLIDSI